MQQGGTSPVILWSTAPQPAPIQQPTQSIRSASSGGGNGRSSTLSPTPSYAGVSAYISAGSAAAVGGHKNLARQYAQKAQRMLNKLK
jgi:hypothetical protein